MAVIASATGVALGMTAGTIGAGLVGGAVLGAGAGALYNGFTGGDILNGALTGALIGTAAGGLGAAFAPAAAGGAATGAASGASTLTGAGALAPGASTAANTAVPALAASQGTMAGTIAAPSAVAPLTLSSGAAPVVSGIGTVTTGAAPAAAGLSGMQTLGYGLAGTSALSLLGSKQKGVGAGQMPDPGMIRPYDYSSTPNQSTGIYPSPYATAEYNEAGNPILDTRERNYFSQGFSPMQPYSAKTGTVNPNLAPATMAARGGLMFDDESGMDEARGLMQGNMQKGLFGAGYAEGGKVKHMFNGGLSEILAKFIEQNPSGLNKYEYDNANQRYSAVNQPQMSSGMYSGAIGAKEAGLPTYRFDPAAQGYQTLAAGGHLGGYSDGGRMLKGPGDGMSDDIPGVIGNKQPARLADGEFVVPADVVSHLGNGSTDAGAKRLYAMMDTVRKARTGTKKQGKKIKAEKYLPA
jgi:hypothetical protein